MPVRLSIRGALRDTNAIDVLTRRFATRMLRALSLEAAELSVLVCDDRVMRSLNRQHRQMDRTTDVLAFAMREGMPLVSVDDSLGDVVISWSTARRQARAHRWTTEREVCLLLAHGLLHLLGFDHATKVDERRMMARTHVLTAAGLKRSKRVDKLQRPARGKLE